MPRAATESVDDGMTFLASQFRGNNVAAQVKAEVKKIDPKRARQSSFGSSGLSSEGT